MRSCSLICILLVISCGTPEQKLPKPIDKKPAITIIKESPKPSIDHKQIELFTAQFQEHEKKFTITRGDVLHIDFKTHPKFTQDATVMPDGTLNISGIGSIYVHGLSLPEAEKKITELSRNVGLRDPQVFVSLKSIAPRYVTIIGKTIKSGRVEITGKGTLLEILASIGWQYVEGSPKKVAIFRGGACGVIDLSLIMEYQLVDLNIRLQPDDTLVFTEEETFRIRGEVIKPGDYPIPYKGYATLKEAILLAGGISRKANLQNVELIKADGTRIIFDANPYLFTEQVDQIKIQPGDVVVISPAKELNIFVFGMVEKPGQIVAAHPITISRAIALSVPIKFGAVLSDVKVIRNYPENPEVYSINMDKLFAGDRSQDILLADGDVVFVPQSSVSVGLEFLNRATAPLTSITRVALDAILISDIIKRKEK